MKNNFKKFNTPINVMASSAIVFTALFSSVIPGIPGVSSRQEVKAAETTRVVLGENLVKPYSFTQNGDSATFNNVKFGNTAINAVYSSSSITYQRNTSTDGWNQHYKLNSNENFRLVKVTDKGKINLTVADYVGNTATDTSLYATLEGIDTVEGVEYEVKIPYSYAAGGVPSDSQQEIFYGLINENKTITFQNKLPLSNVAKTDTVTFKFTGTGGKINLAWGFYMPKVKLKGSTATWSLSANFEVKAINIAGLEAAKTNTKNLFSDTSNNNLASTVNQSTIDSVKAEVNKLPLGPDRDGLLDLISKAQNLFDAKVKAEQEVTDAKNKVEGLFKDNNFNALNGSTNQSAIDEAKNAVAKLPAGAEKTRLENLIKDAQNLFDAKVKAEQEAADAKNKVESLFTDNNFNVLNSSVNQTTIDDAQKSLNKLPAGDEKDRLQQLLDKAKELMSLKLTIKADELFVGQNTVYGTSVLSDVYRVYIYLNGELVRYRNVIDGAFYGHVSNSLKAGDVVRLVPTDARGIQGKAIEVIVQENNWLAAPTLNKYHEGDATLSGKVAEGTSYVNVYVNDNLIRKRNVEANGVDLISYLGDAGAKVGDTIKVVPYNNKNEAGKAAILTVVAPPVETTDYLAGDTTLYGKTTATADKVDLYVNGDFLRTRVVDKTTGEFFASMMKDGILPKAGDEIKIVSRTDKGVILSEDTVIVGSPTSQVAPTVNEFSAGLNTISGTIPQGATKVRIYYGTNFSQVLNRGAIDKVNQTFSAYVGDLNLKSGDQIKVVTINDNGRESQPVIVTVK